MSLTYGTPLALANTTTEYVGNFSLNSATSIPNQTNTAIGTARNQWSLISASRNVNASALINATGSVVFPENGTLMVTLNSAINTAFNTQTTGNQDVWFIVTPAAGGTAPRLGWARAGMVQLGASYFLGIASSVFTYNGMKGDILTPYIFQSTGSTVVMQNDTTNGVGSSGTGSTAATSMTVTMLKRFG